MSTAVPSFVPPFEALEDARSWGNVSVQMKWMSSASFYDLAQNGPFFFFRNIGAHSSRSSIEFTIFSRNFIPMKEIVGGRSILKLQHFCITDVVHLLTFGDDGARDEFVQHFFDVNDALNRILSQVEVSECQLPCGGIYSYLPTTKELLETRCFVLENFGKSFVLRSEVKSAKGYRPKMDIKLGTNCVIESAVPVPALFKTNLELMFHVQDISSKDGEIPEGFFLCTTIEDTLKWILSITKWSSYAENIHVEPSQIMLTSKKDSKPKSVHRKALPPPPTPTPPSQNSTNPIDSIMRPIKYFFSSNKTPEQENPPLEKPKVKVLKKTNFTVSKSKAIKNTNSENDVWQKIDVVKPIYITPLADSLPKQNPDLKTAATKPPIVFHTDEIVINSEPEQQQTSAPTKPKIYFQTETDVIANKLEVPAVPKPQINFITESPITQPPINTEKIPNETSTKPKGKRKTANNPVRRKSPNVTNNNDTTSEQKPSLLRRKSSGSMSSIPTITTEINQNKEKPTRKHIFPQPKPLAEQLQAFKKRVEKPPTQQYVSPSLKGLLPNTIIEQKYKEQKKQEIFKTLSKDINFSDFESFDFGVFQSTEQIVSETTKDQTFANNSTDFSFFNFANIEDFNKDTFIHPPPIHCEFLEAFSKVKTKLTGAANPIINPEDASRFVFLVSGIIWNGFKDFSPKFDTEVMSCYQELQSKVTTLQPHLSLALAQKNPVLQVSVFVQSLIISSDIVPFLISLSYQYEFLSRHYLNESLISTDNFFPKVVDKIDEIMKIRNFSFEIKPEIIKGHESLNAGIVFLLPDLYHTADHLLILDPSNEKDLKKIVHCAVDQIVSGNIKSKPWNFVLEVGKKQTRKGEEWKMFCHYAKNPYGFPQANQKSLIKSFVKSGIKRRKLHIWFTFLATAETQLTEYYVQSSPLRDKIRAKHVISIFEQIMAKLGPTPDESSSSER